MRYGYRGFIEFDKGDRFLVNEAHCNCNGEIQKGEECEVLETEKCGGNYYTIQSVNSKITVCGAILGGLGGDIEITYDAYLKRKPRKEDGVYETAAPCWRRKRVLSVGNRFIMNEDIANGYGTIYKGEECEVVELHEYNLYSYDIVSINSGLLVRGATIKTDKITMTYEGTESLYPNIPAYLEHKKITGMMVKSMFSHNESVFG